MKALLLTIASSIVTLIALEGLLRISLDHEHLFSAARTPIGASDDIDLARFELRQTARQKIDLADLKLG